MAKYPVLVDGVNPEAVWNKAGGTIRIKQFLADDLILVENPDKFRKQFGKAMVDFEFTVPLDYNHETQIAEFLKRNEKYYGSANYFHRDLTSANFSRTTNKLIPGKTYRVRIFPILTRVSSQDCFNFLEAQTAILVGAPGLTLLDLHRPEAFPKGKYTVSFDKLKELWEDFDGCLRLPAVDRVSAGRWDFNMVTFEYYLSDSMCLVSFSDVQTSDA